MKKILVVLATMVTVMFAGGDIAPIETAVTPDTKGFYVGGGYAYNSTDVTDAINEKFDGDNHGLFLVAGYDFNKYIAVEGRFNYGFESGYTYNGLVDLYNLDTDISVWSAFIKPQYPISDDLKVYGLIGLSNTTVTVDSIDVIDGETSFAWGVGAAYTITNSINVFIDYTNLYNDTFADDLGMLDSTFDGDIYTVNIGVTYKF